MSEIIETVGCKPCPKCGERGIRYSGTEYDWRCEQDHSGHGNVPARCPECGLPCTEATGPTISGCRCSVCGNTYSPQEGEFKVPDEDEVSRLSRMFKQPPLELEDDEA